MKYVLYKGLYLQKGSKARELYDNQKFKELDAHLKGLK